MHSCSCLAVESKLYSVRCSYLKSKSANECVSWGSAWG